MEFINTLLRPPIFSSYYNFKLSTFFVQAILTTAIGIGDFEIFVWLKNKSIQFYEMWTIYQLSTAHSKTILTDRLKIWQRAPAKKFT